MWIIFIFLVGLYFNRNIQDKELIFNSDLYTNISSPNNENIYSSIRIEKNRLREKQNSDDRFNKSKKPYITGIIPRYFNTLYDELWKSFIKNKEFRKKREYRKVIDNNSKH